LVAIAGTFYFVSSAGVWAGTHDASGAGIPYPIFCGTDNSPQRVPKPDPTMVDRIVIPITCDDTGDGQDGQDSGGGSTGCEAYGPLAAIKSLSTAGGRAELAASAAAILVVLTSLLLVAVRRRRLGRRL
jgi:hypothetical protein